jgi:hypothetical protein
LAADYAAKVSELICGAGKAPSGTVLMPITQEELVVNSRDEARALGVELVTRLFVARAPNGTLMFFMLPKEAAEGKAEGVARRLGSGVHPLESLEPEKWGGLALQGVEGVRQLPSVGATLAALRELRRKLGAHSAALHPLHHCTSVLFTAVALHLCTSAPAPINIPLISFASSCAAPPPPHPATAGEKGAAAAGATLCPKADLSRLKVDRAKLLEKIKAREALSDDELECVHLGLVACGAPTRTAAPTHCGLVRARASAGSKQLCTPAPTPGNGRREGRCCGRRHPLPGG